MTLHRHRTARTKNSGTHRCLRGKTCGRGCRGPEQHFHTTRLLALAGRGTGAGAGIAFLASWRIRGEELVIPLDTCGILNHGLTPLLDIRAAMAYCVDIAPDIWQLSLGKYGEAAQDRSFLLGRLR